MGCRALRIRVGTAQAVGGSLLPAPWLSVNSVLIQKLQTGGTQRWADLGFKPGTCGGTATVV